MKKNTKTFRGQTDDLRRDSNPEIKFNQTELIMHFMRENGSINPLEALQHIGCFRLSARIHQLRKNGYQITSKRVTKNGRFGAVSFAEYHLKIEVE